MVRKLSFSFGDQIFDFLIEKLDRNKLYGSRDVLAVDTGEKPLRKGYLDEWGSVVISSTGMGYIDRDKTWRDKSELMAVDSMGNRLQILPSSFEKPVELEGTANLEEFCEHEITSVYILEGFEQEGLIERMNELGNRMYCFPFVYRSGYEAKTAFLQAVGEKLFMLIGVHTQLDYLSKPQRTDLDEDMDEDDDLDFSMM